MIIEIICKRNELSYSARGFRISNTCSIPVQTAELPRNPFRGNISTIKVLPSAGLTEEVPVTIGGRVIKTLIPIDQESNGF
jgi:hypothetical protein